MFKGLLCMALFLWLAGCQSSTRLTIATPTFATPLVEVAEVPQGSPSTDIQVFVPPVLQKQAPSPPPKPTQIIPISPVAPAALQFDATPPGFMEVPAQGGVLVVRIYLQLPLSLRTPFTTFFLPPLD